MRAIVTFAMAAVALVAAAPSLTACYDNTDQMVVRLRKLDLSTDQMKSVFAFQNEHRDFVKKSHSDRAGCLAHERHDLVFEKQAIGVLTDAQFKTYTGRVRSESETLTYQNYLLKTEIERLKAEIAALKAQAAQTKSLPAPATEKK